MACRFRDEIIGYSRDLSTNSLIQRRRVKSTTAGVLRLLADGEFHSGVALAQALRVSRASVWNAVRELETMGTAVYKVHGRGYRFPHPFSLLDRAAIERALGGAAARLSVEVRTAAPSTNALLLERAAAGAASGTVIAAEWQSAGRGRRGRTWHAGLGGGLAFSLLWRFAHGASALSGLSLAVGVALARGLAALGGPRIGLKWPNDIVADGGKLGGILIELAGDVLGPGAAVIGVGINVRLSPGVRADIDQPATDLEGILAPLDAPVDRNSLLAGLLVELDRVLAEFSAAGFGPFRAEWESRHAHQGKTVTLLLPDGRSERGRARGVAEDGSLLLETSTGVKRFHSGEVSLRAETKG
jgi:BirA family biotin operon repressor/biotin-[acetyl-CoA-carboxylase] ligase